MARGPEGLWQFFFSSGGRGSNRVPWLDFSTTRAGAYSARPGHSIWQFLRLLACEQGAHLRRTLSACTLLLGCSGTMPPLHFGVLLLVARCVDGYEVGIGPKQPQDSILTPGFLGGLILSFGQGKPWGTSNMASGSMASGLGPKTVVSFLVLLSPVLAVHPGCLTCFGANPACTLHASASGVCPYVEVPATNMNIIQKKESKALCLTNCLFPRFLRCFERGELTTASTLAQRPAPGTTIVMNPSTDKVATIMGYMKSGLVSKDQMETAFAEAIDAETDAAKKKDLRANLQMLGNVKCLSDEGGSDVGQSGLLTWLLAKVTDFVSTPHVSADHSWSASISASTTAWSGPMCCTSSTYTDVSVGSPIGCGTAMIRSDRAIAKTTSSKNILNVPGAPDVPKSAKRWTNMWTSCGGRCVENRKKKNRQIAIANGKIGYAESTSDTRIK